jgi:predicted ATPase
MRINKLLLERYKKVVRAEISLGSVNVLVGGNNAGKSSVLQGIHFAIGAAVASRQQGQKTFSTELLHYNPTPDFSVLRNGSPYLNHTGAGESNLTLYSSVDIHGDDGVHAEEEIHYNIKISKGRNHGNIACNREGDYERIGNLVTSATDLYSVYVPGLAGISQYEELRARAIVRRGVASGDANLYLRNIIYYIHIAGELNTLNQRLATIFPDTLIEVEFDEQRDHRIKVFAAHNGTRNLIELCGTGLLQVLQIYSYITYFNPKLLLLDEPDSHLHPNNQIALCNAISYIAESTGTQVLLSTHSRHMMDALADDAHFVWMRNGEIQEQGSNLDRLPMLLDLGALDDFDRLRNNEIDLIVLTEDRKTRYLERLLELNGFNMGRTLIYSYKTSSNLESASLFTDFLKNVSPGIQVMIHRDRDFMTDEESAGIEGRINQEQAIPFITAGSDIESYFILPDFLASMAGIEDPNEVVTWLDEVAFHHHMDIQHQFTRKRDEIFERIHKRNRDAAPDTRELMGVAMPLPIDKRKGKFMIKRVRDGFRARFGISYDENFQGFVPACATLQRIAGGIWPAAA